MYIYITKHIKIIEIKIFRIFKIETVRIFLFEKDLGYKTTVFKVLDENETNFSVTGFHEAEIF